MARMTLERLLRADPLGAMWKKVNDKGQEAYDIYGEEFETESFQTANSLLREAMTKDPQKNAFIRQQNAYTDEGIAAIAEICGANFEDLKRYLELSTFIHTAGEKAYKPTLKHSWRALLPRSNIIPLGKDEFPAATNKPFIIFYSADWCFPCWVTKPTFARLSRFFDKAPLFYTSDDGLRQREGIKYVPYLVVYLANGSAVISQCGQTTEKLWNALNTLITLGKGFEGRGELVCDENECKIVTENKSW